MNNTFTDKPTVNKYNLNPYEARALILNLELQYNITVRVYETRHCCHIFIDKEVKKDEPN